MFTGSDERKTRAPARRWGGTFGKERDRCYHQPCDDADNPSLRMLGITATAALRTLRSLSR